MCASSPARAQQRDVGRRPRDEAMGRRARGQFGSAYWSVSINITTINIIDSFTALAHRSWILKEALPRKRGRLDELRGLKVVKGGHVVGVLADDCDRHVGRRRRALRAGTTRLSGCVAALTA